MWQSEFLNIIKPKDKKMITSIIAEVVCVSPIKITFFNKQCFAFGNQLILTDTFQHLLDSDELKVGDSLIVVPYNDLRKFILIDKVVN